MRTVLYYSTAFLAPLAAGLTLPLLVDHVGATSSTHTTVPMIMVIVLAAHHAIAIARPARVWLALLGV